MASRSRIEGPVATAIYELASDNPTWTPAQVHHELGEAAPSLRTVQRYVAELRRRDESGPWSIEDGDPTDVPLVLEVIRPYIENASPSALESPHWPTKQLAGWIIRLRRAYPDLLDLRLVHLLAVLASQGHVDLVRTYLTFTPWLDPRPLFGAVVRGVVRPDVLLALGPDFSAWSAAQQDVQTENRELWAGYREATRLQQEARRALVTEEKRRLEEEEPR